MAEKIKAKDMTEFEGPVDTGNPHGKRPADKKVGDIEPDESVGKKGVKGAELPGATNVGEEIEALFADVEGLSEGFITKASTIFEGAVSEKVELIREQIEAEYNEKLDEAYEVLAEDLEGKLDEYLNLFIETYMTENKIAIERGFKTEIAESVIQSMRSIAESAGVDLPEDKIDIADALVSENEELEGKYNSVLTENIELKKSIRKYQVNEAFAEHTENLTDASKDKLRRLTENLDFANVEQFVEKLNVLKESFVDAPADPSKKNLTEASEEVAKPEVTKSPVMDMYIKAARGNYFGQNK